MAISRGRRCSPKSRRRCASRRRRSSARCSSILPYRDEEEAIAIANDTVYGLGSHVQSGDPERARRVARLIRAGQVHINFPAWYGHAPFGGYKRSGNGREYGVHGLEEYLEVKAILGY